MSPIRGLYIGGHALPPQALQRAREPVQALVKPLPPARQTCRQESNDSQAVAPVEFGDQVLSLKPQTVLLTVLPTV